MNDAQLPSGAQHEIRHGDQHAVIVEVGGGLRSYARAGAPVLDGYGAHERCGGGRGQALMPWPNRLRDGHWEYDGAIQELPITERATATAIHGLVRWASWTASVREPARLVMTHTLFPQPGWPGTLELSIAYALFDDGLTVTVTAVNVGPRACPFGAGFHPYLVAGTERVNEITLGVPGGVALDADERGLPAGRHDVAGTELDFRRPRMIGEAQLDTCYTSLERDPDGRARVTLTGAGREPALWVDETFGYLMVFTGDTLPVDRRRQGLAVEPMTCPPDALASGEAVIWLEPGSRFTGSWGIELR